MRSTGATAESTCLTILFDREAASILRSVHGSKTREQEDAPRKPFAETSAARASSPRDDIRSVPVEAPDAFQGRLRAACMDAVARFGRGDLTVSLNLVIIDDTCPPDHREAVLQAASVMIGNAIGHGFYEQRHGHIDVWFTGRNASETRLDVSDDGWGFDIDEVTEGRGFRLLRSLGKVSQHTRAINTGRQMTTVSLVVAAFSSNQQQKSTSMGDAPASRLSLVPGRTRL